MTKFYSEYGEDAFAASLGILPEKGFYLDLGCAWPCLNSNTAFLRDRGWDGANIDGNASYEPNWSGVATFTHCIISDRPYVKFSESGVPELSRIVELPMESISSTEGIASTRRLDELLEYSPHVDFISCDLEGHEYEALKTFDWKKNRPTCIVAEYNTAGIGEDYRVKEMLEGMGYRVVHQTVANLIYVCS